MWFLLPLFLAFAGAANAVPIEFQVTFTVQSTDAAASVLVSPPVIGQNYYATLSVDDSVLAVDGCPVLANVVGFTAQIGDTIWSNLLPLSGTSTVAGNQFAGFRAPVSCGQPSGTFGSVLGFDVQNGVAVGLWGGVFGRGDVTFIDFFGNSFGSAAAFQCIPGRCGPDIGFPQYDLVNVFGALTITRLPEPATVAVLAVALVGIAAGRTRRG